MYIEGEVPQVVSGGNNGGNNGSFLGSDAIWAVLLFALIFRGWGNNGNGGNGGFAGYPYSDFGVQAGFNQQSIMAGLNGISNAVTTGFGNAEVSRCNAVTNILQTLNANQNAMSNGFYDLAMANQKCCCENRLASANLQSTIIQENCADRQALNEGVRDIIASNTANTQAILDKLCQQEIDAKNDQIATLRTQLNMANLQASQTAQTALLREGQVAEIDALYNRLRDCPVGTMPVYGNQPIFTCPRNNNGCGCGCNGLNIQ